MHCWKAIFHQLKADQVKLLLADKYYWQHTYPCYCYLHRCCSTLFGIFHAHWLGDWLRNAWIMEWRVGNGRSKKSCIPPHHKPVLRPFFRDHPGVPVPEENFWTSCCQGRHTDHPAWRHSIQTNQCPPPSRKKSCIGYRKRLSDLTTKQGGSELLTSNSSRIFT